MLCDFFPFLDMDPLKNKWNDYLISLTCMKVTLTYVKKLIKNAGHFVVKRWYLNVLFACSSIKYVHIISVTETFLCNGGGLNLWSKSMFPKCGSQYQKGLHEYFQWLLQLSISKLSLLAHFKYWPILSVTRFALEIFSQYFSYILSA